LLKHLISIAYARPGIIKIRLSVNSPQETALKLYQKLGFREYGRPKYEVRLNGEYLDQIEMELIFDDKLKNAG
jgi:RimJ/RimL family protein N-acetyltransferase